MGKWPNSLSDITNLIGENRNPLSSYLTSYIDDYVNDPRKTRQEIQELLSNIRPDGARRPRRLNILSTHTSSWP